jgi:hypothetical protein
MTQKGGWQNVANILNASQNRAGKHKLKPSNAFVALNSAPPILPAVTVDASAPATAQAISTAAFTLTLLSNGYASAVHILASPPAPAGKNTFPDAVFKAIGFLDNLTAGQSDDIASLYAAAFGTPEPGAQIALKLIGTSSSGIRLTPLVILGIVGPAAPSEPGKKSPLHIG